MVCLLPFNRAISSLLLTSLLFRDAFNGVPDIHVARVSASRIADLLSQEPAIPLDDKSGIRLVRALHNYYTAWVHSFV